MKVLKEMAAVLPAARKSKLQFESYQKGKSLSSLKFQIGELLLFGDKQQMNFWKRFELKLRQYLELNYLGKKP